MNYRHPQYLRGEICIFTLAANDDLSDDFVREIAKKLGAECLGEELDGMWCIRTLAGMELEVGQSFIDNYPEFFCGYERVDIRLRQLWDDSDELTLAVEELRDTYTGGAINKKEFNQDIDKIIEKLTQMKID